MKTFWRWVGTVFFASAFIFLVLTAIGTSLPIEHHASCSATYFKPASVLFAALQDDAGSAMWRSDIASASLVSGRGPTAVWRETDRHGNSTTFRTVSFAQDRSLVRAVDFVPGMPFAGTWSYGLSAVAPDLSQYRPPRPTRLTIIEDGRIYNPFFRFMARYVFGYTARMHTYLADLAASMHEGAQISCTANP
ncbi:MAG TPA: hypothetical protein VJN22_08050 [Candidatus Eremiobacteraceae bacterium]|nr:hypothetical protein [Candidatus Eremiobacteraceae bacterium]